MWQTLRRQLPWRALLPFALNLLFNLVYTPIQLVIWPRVRWVAYVNIPYLLWVAFATVLQLTITALNWS